MQVDICVPGFLVDPCARTARIRAGVDDRLELTEAIAKLPEDQRIVIEMKYFVGLTNDEVAALMDRSPGAINALQHRAHEALRDLVDGGGTDA